MTAEVMWWLATQVPTAVSLYALPTGCFIVMSDRWELKPMVLHPLSSDMRPWLEFRLLEEEELLAGFCDPAFGVKVVESLSLKLCQL